MTYLLDVNVLVALIDPNHVGHEAAHHWFETEGGKAWATCPITENGVIRIVGNVRYPSTPGSPAEVASIMAQMCKLPGHRFWAEDISLLVFGMRLDHGLDGGEHLFHGLYEFRFVRVFFADIRQYTLDISIHGFKFLLSCSQLTFTGANPLNIHKDYSNEKVKIK